MSAPIGYLKALIYGVPFTFDGKIWGYPENYPECIDSYALPLYVPASASVEEKDYIMQSIHFFFGTMFKDLNSSYPWMQIGHHTHLMARAKIILNYAAGDAGRDWNIVECIPDPAWDEPLPFGAAD